MLAAGLEALLFAGLEVCILGAELNATLNNARKSDRSRTRNTRRTTDNDTVILIR